MKKRLTFGKPTEVTNRGDDSRSFLFPVRMVPADLIGAPEESQATTSLRLIVTVTQNRLPAWRLTDSELIRVLFEIGRRAVGEKIKSGALKQEERILVNPESHPGICPFDPSVINEPEGAVFEIDEDRRIGFK